MFSLKLTLGTLVVLSLWLGACGGGSGSGDSTLPHLNPVSTYPTGRPPSDPDLPPDTPLTELELQRGIWDGLGIANYRYTLQRTVFNGPQYTDPVIVEVRGGQVISRTYANTGQPVTIADPSWWPAIEGLFDIIQDAQDRNAAVAEARYDPNLGYPTWGNFDDNLGLADDEHSFTAGSFQQLP